ncbi:MAG: M20/M25/M40 family metallo-hydrolase, partial [Gemmatimonadota bacterium]|nr:M20/M25/M40 family metallo-hydrolase [Gemmatimonadota bacterium]
EGRDENGRPIVIPGTDPTEEGNLGWPSLQGAANWFSPSYSPLTRLFYQPTRIMGAIYYKADVEYEPGQPFMGGGEQALQGEEASGAVKALDVLTGELVWEFPLQTPPWAGVMATAGNLVFGGSDEGNIFALNAETGEPLWNFQAGAAVRSGPMSYEIDGQQRIVNSAGGTMFVFGLPEDGGAGTDGGQGAEAAGAEPAHRPVDLAMLAKIREEGLQRSQLPNTLSYMTDVVGARLTNSAAMDRAQEWALGEMRRMGLENAHREPFMNYGASWDNEFVSVHMMEPDYQPLVAYPIAHTPGTDGRQRLDVVLADVRTRDQLEPLRGRLRGLAVMSTPPPVIDLERFATGTPRRTDEEMRALEEDVIPPPTGPRPRANAQVLTAAERLAFYVEEGVALVLESNSGWPGAVRGFARPGAKVDRWDRDVTLSSVPIVAVTPEHYNRMYRILGRGIPVTVEAEVRNVHGAGASEAINVLGEIPGTDLAHEVVMLGAHFDTWHASPNASDNTSGTAVMLEAMRILKAVGARPRRTVRIALWSGEEQGIFGSTAYVVKHFGSPGGEVGPGGADGPGGTPGTTPAYDDFSVYFNQDYGPGQYRGIWLQGNEHARSLFASWMEPLRDLGMTTISPRSVGSTDHIPFDRAGLPGFQFLQARVGGTGGHTNLDFYDTLPIDDLIRNAVIMASFVYNAAMDDVKVPRKNPQP